MKKSIWIALILMLVCIFSFFSCDQGDTPPNNDGNNDNNNSTECQHTFGNWNTVKQATCKEEGSLIRTCSKCYKTEESTISKTDTHIWTQATCSSPKKCQLCGTIEGEPLEHDWGNPTCTTPRSCLVCWTVDEKSEALGHTFVNGECQICGDQSEDYLADYDKYLMAAHLYQAVIDSAKFPSSVRIERAYYINDFGKGFPAVRLECAAANSMGGYGILYGVVIQYPSQGYEDNPYADHIYVYEDLYCFECSIYDSCPVINYNGYEKLDIERIITVHNEDINFD